MSSVPPVPNPYGGAPSPLSPFPGFNPGKILFDHELAEWIKLLSRYAFSTIVSTWNGQSIISTKSVQSIRHSDSYTRCSTSTSCICFIVIVDFFESSSSSKLRRITSKVCHRIIDLSIENVDFLVWALYSMFNDQKNHILKNLWMLLCSTWKNNGHVSSKNVL